MSERCAKVTIFLASPSDVGDERAAVAQAVQDLNSVFAPSLGTSLHLKRWETDVWPGFGDDAQAVVNQRIGDCDIFIGILWSRFGTPTARAASGTAEEFEHAYTLWKQYKRPSIMLYFRRSPAELQTVDDLEQKRRVLEFKEQVTGLGALFREYSTVEDFRRLIPLHLIQELLSLHKAAEMEQLHARVEDQQRRLDHQQHTINQIVTYSMADYLFRHLQRVYHGQRGGHEWPKEYIFEKNQVFERDLRFLRDHGYIAFLEVGPLPNGVNLVDCVELTPIGIMCVQLREGLTENCRDV